ncbi:hypothetical protein BD779DRAFT_1476949 [Infundibulicybe gibba]|nr:hypothetical protein BD779DRAFT_1476949 [Infundibulicybe gibba]
MHVSATFLLDESLIPAQRDTDNPRAVQNFQALARAIQAANDYVALQHLSMVQLPPYSSILPNTVAPAADVAVSPPASVKASTPIPHTTPNSPAAAPAEIPESRPSSPGAHSPAATPAEIPESRSPSPSAHSTGTDSDDWDGFGSNPIALIDESDLPISLQAPAPNNSVGCPEPTRIYIETVPEDRWYAVIVGRRPGIIRGASTQT